MLFSFSKTVSKCEAATWDSQEIRFLSARNFTHILNSNSDLPSPYPLLDQVYLLGLKYLHAYTYLLFCHVQMLYHQLFEEESPSICKSKKESCQPRNSVRQVKSYQGSHMQVFKGNFNQSNLLGYNYLTSKCLSIVKFRKNRVAKKKSENNEIQGIIIQTNETRKRNKNSFKMKRYQYVSIETQFFIFNKYNKSADHCVLIAA